MAEKGLLMLNQRYGIAPRVNKEIIPGGSLFSNKNVYELIKNDNKDLLPKKYVLSREGGLKLGNALKDIKTFNKDQPDILRRLDFYLESGEKSLKDNTEILSDTLQLNTEQKQRVEQEVAKLEKNEVSKETKQEVQRKLNALESPAVGPANAVETKVSSNTGKGKKLFANKERKLSELERIKLERTPSIEENSDSEKEEEEEEEEKKEEILKAVEKKEKNEASNTVEITKYQKEAFNAILKGENIKDYEDKPVTKRGLVIITPIGGIKHSYRSFTEFKDSEQYKDYKKQMSGYKATKKYGVPIVFQNGDVIFTLPSKVYNATYPTNTMKKRNKKKYKRETSLEKEEESLKDVEKTLELN